MRNFIHIVALAALVVAGIAPVQVAQAGTHTINSPRDAASGLATGKRTHKPVTIRVN